MWDPKDFLSPQAHLNMSLCMALPPRGPRPSSAHQWAGTSPDLQEGCTSLQTSLTNQGADTRCKKLSPIAYRPRLHTAGLALLWDQLGLSPDHYQANTSFGTPQTPYPNVSGTSSPPQQSDTSSGITGPCRQTLGPGSACQ